MSAITEYTKDKLTNVFRFKRFRRHMRGRFLARLILRFVLFVLLPLHLLIFGYGLVFNGEGVHHKIADFADFRVRDVSLEVTANRKRVDSSLWNVNKKDIIQALGTFKPGQNIFDVSLETLRARVASAPWVKSATVRLRLPDTILISVEERIPFALWQIRGKFYLIDKSGAVITDKNPENYSYPWVVGEGAEKEAADYLSVIADFPAIKDRIKAAYRVGNRRWNLKLYEGTEIFLSESNPRASLERLSELTTKYDILRKASLIDLRLSGKTFIRLKDKEAIKTLIHGNEV